jgi:hypothetical protein
MKKKQQLTAHCRKAGVMSFNDSFVQGSSLVFQLNFCATKPRLRQSAKRQTV